MSWRDPGCEHRSSSFFMGSVMELQQTPMAGQAKTVQFPKKRRLEMNSFASSLALARWR
jgi:hypothetical protein